MNQYVQGARTRYRAIATGAWNEFGALDSDGFKLLMYLWFGPPSTAHGILRLKDGYALTDLEWDAARLRDAWQVLEQADLVWRDRELVIVVPYLRSNPPPNDSVMKGWRKGLGDLPDSPLFEKLREKASAWLTEEGLTWLSDKVRSPCRHRVETVPALRTQSPVFRTQGSETICREKDTGEVQEGEKGGPPESPIDGPLGDRLLGDRNPVPGDSPLITLFLQLEPEAARQLAKRNGYSRADIHDAEVDAAERRFLARNNT